MKRTQAVGFVHLGQLSYIVDIGGLKVGCDVFLTPLEGRLVNPPVKPEELLDVEVFLGTHDHADHIDRPLWRRLAELGCTAKFLVPAYVAADVVRDTGLKKSQVVGMAQGESVEVAGVRFTAVASAHERLEFDRKGRSRNLGFVVEGGGRRIYHSGDCCPYEGLQSTLAAFGRIDAAFLPINGRDAWRLTHDFIGCMDAHEAVELAGELKVKTLVPGHYDMFKPNLGDVGECVAYAKAKYPKLNVVVPKTGERQELK
jgi:L-ascorbate metabolism protein UlaG (beta-lactamase superfamily)